MREIRFRFWDRVKKRMLDCFSITDSGNFFFS
jgi:hypothetical protein